MKLVLAEYALGVMRGPLAGDLTTPGSGSPQHGQTRRGFHASSVDCQSTPGRPGSKTARARAITGCASRVSPEARPRVNVDPMSCQIVKERSGPAWGTEVQAAGIEPTQRESKSRVLPLDDA